MKDGPTFFCSTHWDTIYTVRGRNCGVWQEVFLSACGDVLVEDPFVKTDLPLPDTSRADISVEVTLRNLAGSARSGVLSVNIGGGISVSKNVTLAASESKTVTLSKGEFPQLSMANPRLWWPNGYGEQNLYQADVEFKINGVVSDHKSVKFGVREYSYPIVNGMVWIKCNGELIFCRGGNWLMDEANKKIHTPGFYENHFKLMKDQNFNILRNWSGQSYDQEMFDMADKYGIMIWNDFWMSSWGGPDPADSALFMDNVRDYIKRVRNSPALLLYCARNEDDPPPPLDTQIPQACSELDGTRLYIPHSAHPPVSGFGPWDHRWPDWLFNEASSGTVGIFEKNKFYDLHSEIGLSGCFDADSAREMLKPGDLWPITDAWGMHDWNYPSNADCDGFERDVASALGGYNDLDAFEKRAKVLNYEQAKAVFEAWKAHLWERGGAVGVLVWNTSNPWPSLIWQQYDYYWESLATYYGAKKACEPVHVFWDSYRNRVLVTNDTHQPLSGVVAEARIYSLDGTLKYVNSATLDVPKSKTVDAFYISNPAGLSGVYFIKLRLTKGNNLLSDNFYWWSTTNHDYKGLNNLAQVDLEVSASKAVSGGDTVLDVTLKNTSGTVALMSEIRVRRASSGGRVLPAYFSDNFISLLPGESKRITASFSTALLNGESPKVMLRGWNIVPETVVPGEPPPPPPPTAPVVLSITPASGTANTVVDITDLAGANFATGASVRLERSGAVINASNVVVVSPNKITCRFDLNAAAAGAYDVVVRNPDGAEGRLAASFTVNPPPEPCGQGAGASVLLFGLAIGLLSLAGCRASPTEPGPSCKGKG